MYSFESVQHSVFLVFLDGPSIANGIRTYLDLSSQYYVDRISNTA